jgi:hypothetical protein
MREKSLRLTQVRLEEAEKKISSPAFWNSEGQSAEIGYYIFDYPPEDELIVRDWVQYIQSKSKPQANAFKLVVFDLYEIMMEMLEENDFVDLCFDMEEKGGIDRITKAVSRTLGISDDDCLVTEYMQKRIPEDTVILITGIGKCYPILRAHKIMNKLHEMYVNAPVVMLYPGKYGEKSLILFNHDEEDNFYWVKRLIEN